jgi:archaellum component FlaC
LNEIESLDFVDFIMSESAGIKDEDIEEMSRKDTVDSDRINTVLTQLNQTGNYEFIIVGLTYSATEERVDELRKAYPKLEILVEEKSQRMAILKTEEEKELEAMDELMKLSFVKNTAMVGVVEQ